MARKFFTNNFGMFGRRVSGYREEGQSSDPNVSKKVISVRLWCPFSDRCTETDISYNSYFIDL